MTSETPSNPPEPRRTAIQAAGRTGAPADAPGEAPDRVTELLRGLVAREARAAGEAGSSSGTRLRYVGDYELLEELGRGGMGIVYRARQSSLNREVAVKVVLAGGLAGEEATQRFRAEAEAAARLQHPNIVAVHEVGSHEGLPYFSMDLVDGETLAEIVAGGPLTARRAAGYVHKLAEAIHYAHEQGTLHRDLKPANVLIDANDEPRITDFGLALQLDDDSGLTKTGSALGTPSYMPPEQALGKRSEVGPRSDVYALGAVLYELLTGRPPFQADSPMHTLQQVLEHEPASPRALNPQVPLDLEVVCLKCLQKRPERRYPSARELAEDLGRFLAYEPILARPASRALRVLRWWRGHPWAVAAVAGTAVVTLGGFSYWLWAERAFWQAATLRGEGVPERGGGSIFQRTHLFLSLDVVLLALLGPKVIANTRTYQRIIAKPWWLFGLVLVALYGLLSSALRAKELIDGLVWDRAISPVQLIDIGVGVYFSTLILMRAIYAQEVRHVGATTKLTFDQRGELYDLLKNGPKAEFGKRFSMARALHVEWTGVDPLHAEITLREIQRIAWIKNRESVPHPRRFALPIFVVFLFLIWCVWNG